MCNVEGCGGEDNAVDDGCDSSEEEFDDAIDNENCDNCDDSDDCDDEADIADDETELVGDDNQQEDASYENITLTIDSGTGGGCGPGCGCGCQGDDEQVIEHQEGTTHIETEDGVEVIYGPESIEGEPWNLEPNENGEIVVNVYVNFDGISTNEYIDVYDTTYGIENRLRGERGVSSIPYSINSFSVENFYDDENAEYLLAVDAALEDIDNLSAVSINIVQNRADAHIEIGLVDAPVNYVEGYAYLPSSYNNNPNDVVIFSIPGTSAERIVNHELLHAVGLLHPFEGDVIAIDGIEPGDLTNGETVMDYNGQAELGPWDVAALQNMYGLDNPDAAFKRPPWYLREIDEARNALASPENGDNDSNEPQAPSFGVASDEQVQTEFYVTTTDGSFRVALRDAEGNEIGSVTRGEGVHVTQPFTHEEDDKVWVTTDDLQGGYIPTGLLSPTLPIGIGYGEITGTN